MNGIYPGTRFERLVYCLKYNGNNENFMLQFCDKGHDELLSLFIRKLNRIQNFIDYSSTIENLQGLQDSGVDILIKFSDGSRVGIQIKSAFDINQKDFSKSVKAQITDSFQYHELEKYILLFCPCPEDKGALEKVKAFQASIEKSTHERLIVFGPEILAGFLFGNSLPDEFKLMEEWSKIRSISKEISDHEIKIEDLIRVRYLLCKNVKEAKNLLLKGKRDHFPLSGSHSTIPTPSFQYLQADKLDLESRSITTSKMISGYAKNIDISDLPIKNKTNLNSIKKWSKEAELTGSSVKLIPDVNEPIIQEHLNKDPLTEYLMEQGTPQNELLKFYANDDGCAGGTYLIVETRQIEVVILEISAIDHSVKNLDIYLAHKGSSDLKFLSLENENKPKNELFKYPPRILKPTESILVPSAISLKKFDSQNGGNKIREKKVIVSSATISGDQYDEMDINHVYVEENAKEITNEADLFSKLTEVTHLGFTSQFGYDEKVSVRSLDRSKLLYINEWLSMGCCPYLMIETRRSGWVEYGIILNFCNAKVGTQIVEMPVDWTGNIKIEEREPEISIINSIEIVTPKNGKESFLDFGEIVLNNGEHVYINLMEEPDQNTKIIFTGYFIKEKSEIVNFSGSY